MACSLPNWSVYVCCDTLGEIKSFFYMVGNFLCYSVVQGWLSRVVNMICSIQLILHGASSSSSPSRDYPLLDSVAAVLYLIFELLKDELALDENLQNDLYLTSVAY